MVEFRNQTLQGKHPFFYRRSFKSISHKILYTTPEAIFIWMRFKVYFLLLFTFVNFYHKIG